MPAKAQYQPIAKGVSVNPTNSILQGPLDFFYANSNQIWRVIRITNLDSLAKATNGLHVSPVLTNATVKGTTILPAGSFLILPSGLDIMAELAARGAATNGLFVGPTLTNANLKGELQFRLGLRLRAPGAQIGFDRVTISGTPSNPTDATTKGAVDSLANIIFISWCHPASTTTSLRACCVSGVATSEPVWLRAELNGWRRRRRPLDLGSGVNDRRGGCRKEEPEPFSQ